MKIQHQKQEQMPMLVRDGYLERIQNPRNIFRQILQSFVFVAINIDLNGKNTRAGWHWEKLDERH